MPKGCFLTTEDEPQFRILFGEYIATYNPQHRDEYDLLTEAVYCKWRQQRYWLAETGQVEIAIARNEANLQKELPRADHAAHLANGIANSADLMQLYLRQNNQLHRQYLRCLKELRDLQAERQARRLPPDLSPKEANPSTEHTEASKSPDRQEGGPVLPISVVETVTNPGSESSSAATPNEANEPGNPTPEQEAVHAVTPEQARLAYMRAEIQRFEEYQAKFLAREKSQTNPT